MENTQKTYTLREVVMITADILKGIQVPVELSEQIGLPVLSAIRNLGVIAHQMEEAEVAAEIQKEKPEEPEEGKKNGRKADS